jgi:hypothetical protein
MKDEGHLNFRLQNGNVRTMRDTRIEVRLRGELGDGGLFEARVIPNDGN